MKILITGGHGHLAQEFIRLYGDSHELHATVRTTREGSTAGAKYVIASRPEDVRGILRDSYFDAIAHLAQPTSPTLDPADSVIRVRDEILLFAEIMEHAAREGVERLFLASTGGLYSDSPNPLKESDRLLEPPELDPYYASKLAMEAMVSPHFDRMDITIGRFFFIYGPAQDPKKLVSRLTNSIKSRMPITISNSGGVRLNPIYVSDAARVIGSCLEIGGSRIVNVAGPETTSIKDISDQIASLLGIEPVFETGGLDRNLVADTSLMESMIADSLTGLDEGLARTLAYRPT